MGCRSPFSVNMMEGGGNTKENSATGLSIIASRVVRKVA